MEFWGEMATYNLSFLFLLKLLMYLSKTWCAEVVRISGRDDWRTS
jgi:hypothetical protein